jgi:hypothetical protein
MPEKFNPIGESRTIFTSNLRPGYFYRSDQWGEYIGPYNSALEAAMALFDEETEWEPTLNNTKPFTVIAADMERI